ncbi:MAG TPA: tryptophan synthase subunit alpha [Sulfurospirillum sp. UBA12182]|nr:MAG TPA: tryptophan synthase subunit alpha [Sulfurospirillum sp. UBA12182]
MKELVGYITAGFPSVSFSVDLALSMKDAGVDKLELGIPFSDPVADGPVIELANLKALQNGFKIQNLLDISSKISSNIDTFWMGYFNSFYHKGFESFTCKAHELGVKGFIIPDLPLEEAKVYAKQVVAKDMSLISFVAPTDSRPRVRELVSDAKGFIYLVAYAGITGSGASEDLSGIISSIKEYSKTPVFVGFGVDEKSAKEKAEGVDGVIVGSAFVKVLLDDTISDTQKIKSICEKARIIKEKINA